MTRSTSCSTTVHRSALPLSTDAALKVERVTGISAELLTSLDAAYQASRGRVAAREKLSQYADWFRKFSIDELLRRSIVVRGPLESQIEQLLKFFGVADPDAFERLYDDASALSFRRTQALQVDPFATALWLRLVETAAESLELQPFDKVQFAVTLEDFPSLTRFRISQSWATLQEQCARAGVAVVFLPEVKGARVFGATRWIGQDRPVIALSGRMRYEDSLWFNFFHEAGHVLRHPRRKSFVHLDEFGDDSDGAETDANDFAREILLRGRGTSILAGSPTHDQVREIARQLVIDPGIVAGQIAHVLGPSGHKKYSSLRRKIDLPT